MSEFKFIFTGTPGAGKTTAIGAISDHPPVVTDASTTDDLKETKDVTTVAMDFGEITLDEGVKVHLYGTPGQERFRFMWDIIVKGGLGLIILLDHSRPNPIEDLDIYLDNFSGFIEETGAVVGVTRMDVESLNEIELEDYYTHLEGRGLALPIIPTDVRDRDEVLMLLDSLMAMLEYN